MLLTCHICGKPLEIINKYHYTACTKETVPFDKYKFDVYLNNFPKLTYEFVYDSYINREYTLPMYLKEFGINYKAMTLILKTYGIPLRTIKESNNMVSVRNKFKETCIEKYGVDNPTRKGTKSYLKREETMLERYGSTNIFSSESFMEEMKKDDIWLERFGLTYHEFRSKRSSGVWSNKSSAERETWIKNVIQSRDVETSIEKQFREMLEFYNLDYEPQYHINGKFFDFYTEGILVEINGDYFHANHLYYNPDDLISYPGSEEVLVKSVWEKDESKRLIANNKGFDVIYIWENEINNCKNHQELYDLFIDRMRFRNIYEQPTSDGI